VSLPASPGCSNRFVRRHIPLAAADFLPFTQRPPTFASFLARPLLLTGTIPFHFCMPPARCLPVRRLGFRLLVCASPRLTVLPWTADFLISIAPTASICDAPASRFCLPVPFPFLLRARPTSCGSAPHLVSSRDARLLASLTPSTSAFLSVQNPAQRDRRRLGATNCSRSFPAVIASRRIGT